MASCMAVVPGIDAIAKYMATFEGMSPGQVTFYRFFFQLVCILPLLILTGGSILRARRPWMNLLRGGLHAAASLMFFVAVKYRSEERRGGKECVSTCSYRGSPVQ